MSKRSWVPALALLNQVGIAMLIPIFMCTFIGIFLDKVTGLEPLFLIIFILLGVGAAFRNLFYIIGKEVKKSEKDHHHHDKL
ncbi:MAG: AtpZ/AtpI family protein [Cellulosilyticaceae bacterium]